MIVLKIIGIVLAVLIALIFIILMLKAKLVFVFSTKNKIELKVKLLFFTLYDLNKKKKKKKKTGKVGKFLKRIFGINALTDSEGLKDDVQESGIVNTVNKVITVLFLLAGQTKWILKRIEWKKLRLLAICGGNDAADLAMEYGALCSIVYPFVGYLDTNFDIKEKVKDINVLCDFDGEAIFETEIIAKIRIIHIVRAISRNLEEATNE